VADLAIALTGAAFGTTAAEVSLDEGALVVVELGGSLDEPPPESALAELAADERAAALAMLPRRRRTWTGGRIALRRALRAASGDGPWPAIGVDDRGAPVLPAGLSGSIAHKDEVAAAIAATGDGRAVGLDLEPRRPMKLALSSRVLCDDEAEHLARTLVDGADRGLELARRFAAKEAIYKAIDPSLRRYVGFREVALAGDARGYEVELRFAPGARAPRAVEVRVLDAGDVLVALARATP
jgi:4'-phosphopantetheinyl transferase EntD